MVNEKSLLDGGEPLEIERKFLIQYPDTAALEEMGCRKVEIRQDYLPNINNKVRRVRKAVSDDGTRYYYTEKFRLSDTVRIEREKEISEEEYGELFDERAEGSNPVIKTRYYYYEGDFCFEIDLCPQWDSQAVVEVELPTETTAVKLPEWMKSIREVTADKRYKNEYLAFNGFEQ